VHTQELNTTVAVFGVLNLDLVFGFFVNPLSRKELSMVLWIRDVQTFWIWVLPLAKRKPLIRVFVVGMDFQFL
jgi:hypothetical protein